MPDQGGGFGFQVVVQAASLVFDHPLTTPAMKRALLDGLKDLKEKELERGLRGFGGATSSARITAKKDKQFGDLVQEAWETACRHVIAMAHDEIGAGRGKNALRMLRIVQDLSPHGSPVRDEAAAAEALAARAGEGSTYERVEAAAMERARTRRDDPVAAVETVHDAVLQAGAASELRTRLLALEAKLLEFCLRSADKVAAAGDRARAYAILRDAQALAGLSPEPRARLRASADAIEAAEPSVKERYTPRGDALPTPG